ncbi:MAG: NifU family protein [SAR324 cluster bacterium]|nr:NifU family protein [SAR324 cluster bacterium]MBF0350203.1 NifU family protein [SAR324 cluster bacterium]
MPYNGDILLYGGTAGETLEAAKLLYENGFDSFGYTESYDILKDALKASTEDVRLMDLPEEQRAGIIEDILDNKIRPALASDGGGLSVLNIDGNQVFVEYHGACGSCPSSTSGTLKFIESQLTISLNHDMQVIPA